jgi:hypothetical protein
MKSGPWAWIGRAAFDSGHKGAKGSATLRMRIGAPGEKTAFLVKDFLPSSELRSNET